MHNEFYVHLHDPLMAPQDRIAMEILGGVEPEAVSLFSSNPRASISIDVGLNSPFSPSYISQELEIQFIVCLLKHIPVRQLHHHQSK